MRDQDTFTSACYPPPDVVDALSDEPTVRSVGAYFEAFTLVFDEWDDPSQLDPATSAWLNYNACTSGTSPVTSTHGPLVWTSDGRTGDDRVSWARVGDSHSIMVVCIANVGPSCDQVLDAVSALPHAG